LLLGLFSAIVTAFLVDSLIGLQQIRVVLTNALLVNLPEIIYSDANISTLKVPLPVSFQPDATTVRLNSYWSISI
ncbi:hypothetical protein DFH07DRAFT_681855, partial [Mycena maculata]